ncbi:MAG TPA: 2,3-bisphosphoglycerate-dependent phosphoglycerate mutase, partial [Candidatus Tenderia electrophaga]|nr:2,3-bisphosphoglycerate-dependent phosphoglycerate mutase [Candidatus Tenderia electrophaga]
YEILKQNISCKQYVCVHEKSSEWYEHFTAEENDARELKIYISEKLNERYYGDLQGLNKDWAKQHYGAEQVHQWRRSYDNAPPHGESLKTTAERTVPYYTERILPSLRRGEDVLVVAHGNSLRSIIKHIEGMTPQQIIDYDLPTGMPHVYAFDRQAQLVDKCVLSASNQS